MASTYKEFHLPAGPDIDAKERIRQAVNIVDLISATQGDVRRQGANFACRCPWHDDRSPSLTINPARQSWKCWVCNIGGDVFSWTMRKENCNFREALEMLAERANIQLTNRPTAPVVPGSPNDKKTLWACMAWAEKTYHECLLQADSAAHCRQYLEDRGISAESIARFKIGFSPLDSNWLFDRSRHSPYSPAVLEACGLRPKSQSGSNYEMFRGRVLFPIRDPQGRTIAFGGRVLPETEEHLKGKYVNTGETRLFSKSEHLYALDLAKDTIAKTRNITVVEGYTDVVMAHQFGVTDVVAVLGTALGPRHVQNLKRFADRITLVLDGDAAGQKRTNEVLEHFLAAQVDLRILTLPEEYDPCEFFLERGAEAWQQLIGTAVDALEHKIRTATAGIDLNRDLHGANKALENVLATLAHAPNDPLSTPESQRLREQQIIARLAREFRVDEADVRERLKGLRSKNVQRSSAAKPTSEPRRDDVADDRSMAPVPASSLDPRERELLELLCVHPELAPTALQELSSEDLPTPAARELFAVYRQLEEAGENLEFPVVLGELPEHHKPLLIELDDRAGRKEAKAMQDAPTRLRAAIDRLRSHEAEREHREKLAVLEECRLDTDEEKVLLSQIAQQKLRQMGIPPK
jgi:DNA primase